MSALGTCLRRLLGRSEPGPTAHASAEDQIGDHLRAAIAADARAKASNVQGHRERVEAMIDDFFSKYGDRDARHHP